MSRATILWLSVLSACGAGEVGPTARIDLTPDTLCQGAAETAVIVSGKSSVGIDGTSEGLRYAWSFSRPPGEILRGGVEEHEIVAQFSTETAVAVRLQLTDREGRGATRERILGLTQSARAPCAAGCAAHEVCAPFDGAELCVDDAECAEDDDCGCLVCRPDDLQTRRCITP